MNNFKDFNIKLSKSNFVGEKIQLMRILNHPITVLDFRIGPSKHRPETELLTLQIEKGGDKRVVFTGSTTLINQIKQVPHEGFPFETTIRKDNEYCEFT